MVARDRGRFFPHVAVVSVHNSVFPIHLTVVTVYHRIVSVHFTIVSIHHGFVTVAFAMVVVENEGHSWVIVSYDFLFLGF